MGVIIIWNACQRVKDAPLQKMTSAKHFREQNGMFYPCEEGEEGARAMQITAVPRGKAKLLREWALEDVNRVFECMESSPTSEDDSNDEDSDEDSDAIQVFAKSSRIYTSV